MEFAAKVFRLSTLTMAQRASAARLIWDWVAHGRKKVLWNPLESGHCPLCEQAEDLSHILTACPHPELVERRLQIIQDGTTYINNLMQSLPNQLATASFSAGLNSIPYTVTILNRILESAFSFPQGYQFLLGTWNPAHLQLILSSMPLFDKIHTPTLAKHTLQLTRIMGEGALDMVTHPTERQRRIPAFFDRISSSSSPSHFTPGLHSRISTSRSSRVQSSRTRSSQSGSSFGTTASTNRAHKTTSRPTSAHSTVTRSPRPHGRPRGKGQRLITDWAVPTRMPTVADSRPSPKPPPEPPPLSAT